MGNPLDGLSAEEQSCVRRYIDTLAEQLGADLREVWLFGSAARGDMWWALLIRSDIDLLVLVSRPVPEEAREDLVNATFPLCWSNADARSVPVPHQGVVRGAREAPPRFRRPGAGGGVGPLRGRVGSHAMTLAITGDEEADRLLNTNGTALLVGMLLDQQVPMEWAFRGPATLEGRLGHLDASRIAAMEEEEIVEVCRQKPAIHRFPQSMGRRIHALCTHLVDNYDGDGAALWGDEPDAVTLFGRITDLPGYGREKSQIFLALLAKRFGVRPPGWEDHAGPFADIEPRSAADVDGEESLARVREWKRARKAAGRTKQD